MKKKILSLLLLLCLIFTTISAVWAQEEDGNGEEPYLSTTITAAKLHDNAKADPIPDDELYEQGSYSAVLGEGNVITVSARNLKKHVNGEGDPGYWAGFAAIAPEGADRYKAAFAETLEGAAEVSVFDENVDGNGNDGVAVYFDAAKAKDGVKFTLMWKLGEMDMLPLPVTYTVNFDVTLVYGPGDVNLDGDVDIIDARWLLQVSSGNRVLTPGQEAVADVNKDEKIDIIDARWLLQVSSGNRVL